MSDNASYYTSHEFKKFSQEWNFSHITSSPNYPRSNGLSERAVRSSKDLLKNVKRIKQHSLCSASSQKHTTWQHPQIASWTSLLTKNKYSASYNRAQPPTSHCQERAVPSLQQTINSKALSRQNSKASHRPYNKSKCPSTNWKRSWKNWNSSKILPTNRARTLSTFKEENIEETGNISYQ